MSSLTRGRSSQSFGYIAHIDDDGLDAVALTLDFGADAGHFVAVECIRNATVNIEGPHFGISNVCLNEINQYDNLLPFKKRKKIYNTAIAVSSDKMKHYLPNRPLILMPISHVSQV